jgi:hypothetical protein
VTRPTGRSFTRPVSTRRPGTRPACRQVRSAPGRCQTSAPGYPDALPIEDQVPVQVEQRRRSLIHSGGILFCRWSEDFNMSRPRAPKLDSRRGRSPHLVKRRPVRRSAPRAFSRCSVATHLMSGESQASMVGSRQGVLST